MKTQTIVLSVLLSFLSIGAFAQSKTDSIKVAGNCSMCKNKIEKAAKAAGAESAIWNKDSKFLVVSYDASKSGNMAIQESVAKAGYDTEKVKATKDAYNDLDECCQYDRTASADATGMTCCKNMDDCQKDGCCKADMSCCKDHAAGENCCADGKCSKS